MNYISVTAGKDKNEVKRILDAFKDAGYTINDNHKPVIGFQVSDKTIANKYPRNYRMTIFEYIPKLVDMIKDKAVPIIHFNSKKEEFSEKVKYVFDKLPKNSCDIVQININFPQKSELEKIKGYGLKVSLQVDYKDLDLEEAYKKIINYGDSIDYVLIDPSRGLGDNFDFDSTRFLYSKLKENTNYNIVVAGGISGYNMEEVIGGFIKSVGTNDFSICAEGKLRDKIGKHWGQDNLNNEKMKKYVIQAKKVLTKNYF